jgi:hypothetical protein
MHLKFFEEAMLHNIKPPLTFKGGKIKPPILYNSNKLVCVQQSKQTSKDTSISILTFKCMVIQK